MGEDPLAARLARLAVQGDGTRLHAEVETLRDEGVPAEELLAACELLRPTLPDDREELVLDVMDRLVGWCGPEASLS